MEVNVDFQCDLGVRPDSWPFGDGTEKSNGTVEKETLKQGLCEWYSAKVLF